MASRLTEVQRREYRSDPAYSDGFHDAATGDPLFDSASLPYQAGWEAYWACRELLEKYGFSKQDDGSFSVTTMITPAGGAALEKRDE